MTIHIGQEIHKIIKEREIGAKVVAQAVNVSESNLYKIYKRETIDIDKLINFSQFLGINFFLYYMDEEPLKSMFNQKNVELQLEIKKLKELIIQKDKRIKEVTNTNSSLQKAINLLGRKSK